MAAPFVSKSFHTLFLTFVSLCLEVSCGARSLEGKLESIYVAFLASGVDVHRKRLGISIE